MRAGVLAGCRNSSTFGTAFAAFAAVAGASIEEAATDEALVEEPAVVEAAPSSVTSKRD
jgi:hypothetical protein